METRTIKLAFIAVIFCFGAVSAQTQPNFWTQTNDFTKFGILSLLSDSVGNIYAGTISDGLYRSTDMGRNWTRITSSLIDTAVTAMAIDLKGNIFFGIALYPGGGIFRSTDSGKLWEPTGLSDWNIGGIAIDSNNNIYAALFWAGGHGGADGLLLRSNNGGQNWQDTLFSGQVVYGVNVNKNGDIFFIASMSSTLCWSFDNGTSFQWETVFGGVKSIAFNSPNQIYVASDQGIFYSSDNGDTWIKRFASQTDYGLRAVIVNRINRIYAASNTQGAYYSPDDGITWISNNSGLTDVNVYSMTIDPNGILYCGTGSGKVFRSTVSTTGVRRHAETIPLSTTLDQNYPNPFNPTTNLSFTLSSKAFVTLKIFDLIGRDIATLVSEELPAGNYVSQWNGSRMSSGVYFCRLQAGTYIDTKKIALTK